MCGIICEITPGECCIYKDHGLMQRILNRGPDYNNTLSIKISDKRNAFFCGSVLWMQGHKPTFQPVENSNGILLYNGDIFDNSWNSNITDTQLIMDRLSNTMNEFPDYIIQVIKQLKGPFSIIYYDKQTHDFYFTRDKLGRNTLLFYQNKDHIIISSVLGRKYECIEIPATHIYKLNIITDKITLYSWMNNESVEIDIKEWLHKIQQQQCLPDEEFSFVFELSKFNENENIFAYIENVAQHSKCKLTQLEKLLQHVEIERIVSKLRNLLEKSVKIRLKRQPNKCKDCLYNIEVCTHCAVGILFSGGLDCTVLAVLANKFLPQEQSIELLNVAFKKEKHGSYDVPDRLTGRKSFEELQNLCPSRKWVFKEINVSREEMEHYQKTIIADLVYPRKTILDESLGSALWFAARGKDGNGTSACRILLLGSGADELFGGYTRHRNAYQRQGWPGLEKELQLDWRRISYRNLARDNRVICDHGRQPRMPYLDEDFTDFVQSLEPWFKCYPSDALSSGVGDKLILRLVALNLGLRDVVTFPKRALQFGSRIANKKERGSDLSKNIIFSNN